MEVILLEKVDKLGQMGEVVSVKPGYARNFLLPKGKALRANDDNIAYFEKEKAALEKVNAERRAEAQKVADKLGDCKIVLIRQASEGGQLYGSITARDIADKLSEGEVKVRRGQVNLNQNFKTLGLFEVPVELHPEVIVTAIVNVARSEDEAQTQFETGKAVIVDHDAPEETAEPEVAAEEFLEDSALKAKEEAEAAEEQARLEAEQQAAEEEARKQAEAEAAADATEETAADDADEASEDSASDDEDTK